MVRNQEEQGANLQKIVGRLISNQNLLKYLYYTDPDPLNNADLTSEQIQKEIFNKLVKIVPRVGPKETDNSLISMRVVKGAKNGSNPEFQNVLLAIEVFVPLTQWIIKDVNLRPFCIMQEVMNSLNDKTVNGLGRMECRSFEINFLTDEISCYEMVFSIMQYD